MAVFFIKAAFLFYQSMNFKNKKTILFLCCIFLNVSLFCLEKSPAFFIQSDAGVGIRKFGEYIYSSYDNHTVSYLEYNATLTQTNITFGYVVNNFEILANINAVLPLKCGNFYDYDYTADGITKNLCFFNNYSTGNAGGNIFIAYDFSFKDRFLICPTFQLQYNYDSFIGRNGWGYFGTKEYSKNGEDVPWNSEYARKATKVSRISYKTHNFFVFTGIDFKIKLTQKINLVFGTYVSPFTTTYSVDYHFDDTGNNWDYELIETQTSFFKNFKERAQFDFYIKDTLCFIISGEWIFRSVIKGTIYDSYQPSGSDISLAYIGIGIKKKF